jgi:hypothetical protein
MNATVHTAYVLDRQRAAQLDRSNELRRQRAERCVSPKAIPSPGPTAAMVRRVAALIRRSVPATSG